MKDIPQAPPNTRPSIHLNWQDWLPYVEDSTATETEKQQVIETLWSIVTAFVDLGWDVRPTLQETREQTPDLRATLAAAVVCSEDTETEEAMTQSRIS